MQAPRWVSKKVVVRLPGKGNSNSHGSRPVHLIITMIKWIRTSRLSRTNSFSLVGIFDLMSAVERIRQYLLSGDWVKSIPKEVLGRSWGPTVGRIGAIATKCISLSHVWRLFPCKFGRLTFAIAFVLNLSRVNGSHFVRFEECQSNVNSPADKIPQSTETIEMVHSRGRVAIVCSPALVSLADFAQVDTLGSVHHP